MSAATYNFSIEQGTSFGLTFQYANSGNVPIDLSSFSCARMQWNTDIDTVYQFTTNNTNSGLYLFEFDSPLSSGIINFKVPASITAGYNFTTASYDLELESISDFYPGGGPQVIRLLEGSITIIPEITRMNCSTGT
jgi:hypothetical protein